MLDGPPPGPQHDAVPERTAAPADRWALVLGVTDYRAPTHDTVGGAGDARLVRDRLLAAGWLPDHVRVLVDDQVTGAGVRRGLDWLAARARPGTFALVHWSGHVKQLGGGTEALWTVDRDWVTDAALTRSLSRVGGRLWVDVAGCEAGSPAGAAVGPRAGVGELGRGAEVVRAPGLAALHLDGAAVRPRPAGRPMPTATAA